MARFKSHKRPSQGANRNRSRGAQTSLPKEAVTVDISDLNHDVQGVSRSLDKVLFVEGALPGETVDVQITKAQRNVMHGQVKDILQASSERVEPSCPYYKRCGGCQLQHLGSEHQLGYKQSSLHQNLTRHLKLDDLPWQKPIHSDEFGYRRRARLGVRYRNEQDQIIVGFREQANKHLTDISDCPVLLPELSGLIEPLKGLIQGLQQKARITQIELLKADQGSVVVLRHLKNLSDDDLVAVKSWAESQSVQLWLQPDDPEGLRCIWPEAAAPLTYSVMGFNLEFKVKDFIQGNESVNAHMVEQALSWLDPKPEETVLDLFSGIGNFSLPLAKRCQSVTAMEGDANMVQRMLDNAETNGLKNITGKALNLGDNELFYQLPKTDVILLDPPRAGAAELIPWLSKQKARILYVACEPSSLVRDTKGLLEAGYKLSKIGVMDMFPQTKHVESMALFERKK